MPELTEHLLLKVVCHIDDPVTTTDELIPSGETSSFRSNPIRLAEFTLGRKDPEYVNRAIDYILTHINEELSASVLGLRIIMSLQCDYIVTLCQSVEVVLSLRLSPTISLIFVWKNRWTAPTYSITRATPIF